MIDGISNKLTSLIKENIEGITPEKEEIINYGIKIAIYEIMVSITIFFIALVLGVFKYFIFAFIVYGILRIFEGGAHADSRIKCFFTYLVTIFGIIFISKYLPIDNIFYSVPVFIVNFYVAYVYAPGDSAQKPILRKKLKIRLKVISLILTVLVYIAACILWRYDKTAFNVVLLSTVPVTLLLSPIGYKLAGCQRGS